VRLLGCAGHGRVLAAIALIWAAMPRFAALHEQSCASGAHQSPSTMVLAPQPLYVPRRYSVHACPERGKTEFAYKLYKK